MKANMLAINRPTVSYSNGYCAVAACEEPATTTIALQFRPVLAEHGPVPPSLRSEYAWARTPVCGNHLDIRETPQQDGVPS